MIQHKSTFFLYFKCFPFETEICCFSGTGEASVKENIKDLGQVPLESSTEPLLL